MYKLLSKEAISQAILDRFNFSSEMAQEIVAAVWHSDGCYDDESRLTSAAPDTAESSRKDESPYRHWDSSDTGSPIEWRLVKARGA